MSRKLTIVSKEEKDFECPHCNIPLEEDYDDYGEEHYGFTFKESCPNCGKELKIIGIRTLTYIIE